MGKIKFLSFENYDAMSENAARRIAAQIANKPDSVLGLATGSTPEGTYRALVKMAACGEVDFSGVTTFNLDEYLGLDIRDAQSYACYMEQNLFSKVNIRRENTHIPGGKTDDPDAECEAYEKAIASHGGIDLQILGIGQNGHIGFNEPDKTLLTDTHVTVLTESTRKANARFFADIDSVPQKALTMGIATILRSKSILLLASGENKREALRSLLDDSVSSSCPATFLKLHPDVTVLCDKAAFPG